MVCRSVREVTASRVENIEQYFLGAINSHDSFEDQWNVVLHIDRKPVRFKIDTGAYGGPQLSHQNQMLKANYKALTSNSNRSHQIQIAHSKFKSSTAN